MTPARGSSILAVSFLAVGLGNYLFTVGTAHLLGTAAFGVVGFVQSFLLFGAWFTTAGFPWTAAGRIASTDDRTEQAAALRAALIGNIALGTSLGLALLLLLATGALKLASETAVPVLIAAAACSMSGASAAARGGLQGFFRFRVVAGANIAEVLLKLVIGLGLVRFGLGAVGATIGLAAGMLATPVTALVVLRNVPVFGRRDMGPKDLYRATLPIFLGTAGMALLTSLDVFAVKMLAPPADSNEDSGLYQAAVVLGRIPYFFASALTTAVYPYIARSASDHVHAGMYARKGLLYAIVLLSPISLVMIALPEDTLAFFFPPAYEAAAPALRALAAGAPLLAVSAFLLGTMQATGRARAGAIVVLAAVTGELGLLFVGHALTLGSGTAADLVPPAVAFDLAALAITVALLINSARYFGWRVPVTKVAAYVCAVVAAAAIARVMPHQGRGPYIAAAAGATFVYATVGTLLRLLSTADLRTLMSAIPFGNHD